MKYVTVREHLRGLIADGLPVGSPIPSERELCEQFGIARMTVRQAVDALVVEGLLVRVQGRGTFVSEPKVDLQLRLSSFADEMRRRGMAPGTEVLAAEAVTPPAMIAAALKLADGEEAHYVRRLRLADGVPMSVVENWIPVSLAPGLLSPELPESLYVALGENGYEPSWGEDSIEAINVDPEESDLLGIDSGAAGLRIVRRTFSGDVAVDYSRSVYRGDRYALWVPVSAPSPALVPATRHKRSGGPGKIVLDSVTVGAQTEGEA